MVNFGNINNFPIKIIFLTHFILISLSSLGAWSPPCYLFYNVLYMLLLVWSLHNKESEDPVQLAFCVNGISIILDIFVLAFFYPYSHDVSERFSAALAILHLVFRPISTIYLVQLLRERMGNPELMSNIFPSAGTRPDYDDIDREGSGEPSRSGYNFSNAQQI